MIKRHFLWFLLLVGLVFLFEGAGSPPVSSSMPLKGSLSSPSKGMNPASCPMKGTLPCCQNQAKMSLCEASMPDFCFQSTPLKEGSGSQTLRVQAPPGRVLIIPVNDDALAPCHLFLRLSSFSKDVLSAPSVNRPLLI